VNQSTLLYVKLGIVAIFEIGVFVLADSGRIDAAAALTAATTGVGVLVAALGISGGASAIAAAMKK
jgi:hypothetical protein